MDFTKEYYKDYFDIEEKEKEDYNTQKNKYIMALYNDIDIDIIKTIIHFLIDEGYIIKTKGMYPVLHISSKGIDYKKNMDVKTLNKLKKTLS